MLVMEGVKSLILSLIKNGIFGDVEFVSLCTDDNIEVGAQFASSLTFLKLTVSSSSGSELIPLVVKLPFADLELREVRNAAGMFCNEVNMYKEVLPSLGIDGNMCPKLHYGISSVGADPNSDILILENLKHKGFELSRIKVLLDINHISVVIKKIAEFHSLSYIMKYENREKFFELTKMVKYLVLPEKTKDEFTKITAAAMERGVKPLLNNSNDTEILGKCLKLMKRPLEIREMIAFPEEPFAVICHGDFCNNNILYKYDESGKPTACAFFDFQLSQYANPAIDLFFFLYMHTTSDFREMYWDEVLKLYWDSLRNNVPIHISLPDFQQYLNHFSKRAIYGYTICSWFLPMMSEENPIPIDEYKKLPFDKKCDYFSNIRGDEGEKIISEVVLHMLNKGYIKDFMQFCKEKKFD